MYVVGYRSLDGRPVVSRGDPWHGDRDRDLRAPASARISRRYRRRCPCWYSRPFFRAHRELHERRAVRPPKQRPMGNGSSERPLARSSTPIATLRSSRRRHRPRTRVMASRPPSTRPEMVLAGFTDWRLSNWLCDAALPFGIHPATRRAIGLRSRNVQHGPATFYNNVVCRSGPARCFAPPQLEEHDPTLWGPS